MTLLINKISQIPVNPKNKQNPFPKGIFCIL